MSTAERIPEFNREEDDWDFNLDDVEIATFGTKEYLDETQQEIKDLRKRLRDIKSELVAKYPTAERYKKLSRDSEIKSGDNAFVRKLLNEYNETKDTIKLKNKRLLEAEEVFRQNLPVAKKASRHGMHAVPDAPIQENVTEDTETEDTETEDTETEDDITSVKENVKPKLIKQNDSEDIAKVKERVSNPVEFNDETVEFEVPMPVIDEVRKSVAKPVKETVEIEELVAKKDDKQESFLGGFDFSDLDKIIDDIPSPEEISNLEDESKRLPKEISALQKAKKHLEKGRKLTAPGFFSRLFGAPDLSRFKKIEDIRRAERELPERLRELPDLIDEKIDIVNEAHRIYTDINHRLDSLGLKKNKTTADWNEIDKLKKSISKLDEAIRSGSKLRHKKAA